MPFRDDLSRFILVPVGKTYSGRQYFSAKRYQEVLENTEIRPLQELQQRQDDLLRSMVEHAYKNVPYYHALFKSHGISPSDVRDKNDLIHVPFLTKEKLVRNLDSLVAERVSTNALRLVSTGGTTGTPISFYRDKRSEYLVDGNNWRFFGYCGYRVGQRIAKLWGNENDLLRSLNMRGKLKAFMDNESNLNFYDLCDDRLIEYVQLIRRKKPRFWKGFSSALYHFVRYLKRNGMDVPLPEAVIITSDTIEKHQKKELDHFFGQHVFNEYGCREFSILGFECNAHAGIHVGMENYVVEIIRDNEKEAYGEVVVTSLTNWGMPFIRYKLGDLSKFVDGRCSCGRSLPRLETIKGRVADFVVTKSGKLIYGDFFAHLFYGSKGIEHYQVMQTEIGRVTIYLQKNEFFSDGEIRSFMVTLKHMTGDDLLAEMELVPIIERHPSGKRRSVISEISKDYFGESPY